MSKKSLIEREKKRTFKVKKYEKLRRFLKGKIKNALAIEEKTFYCALLQKLPKDSCKTRSLCKRYKELLQ